MSLSMTSTKTTCGKRTLTNMLCHCCWERRKGASSYLKARLTQFLTNEASANVSSTEMDSFESHDAGQDSSFVIGVRVLILYECRKCSVVARRRMTCGAGIRCRNTIEEVEGIWGRKEVMEVLVLPSLIYEDQKRGESRGGGAEGGPQKRARATSPTQPTLPFRPLFSNFNNSKALTATSIFQRAISTLSIGLLLQAKRLLHIDSYSFSTPTPLHYLKPMHSCR